MLPPCFKVVCSFVCSQNFRNPSALYFLLLQLADCVKQFTVWAKEVSEMDHIQHAAKLLSHVWKLCLTLPPAR